MRRLFLFAAYMPDGKLHASLEYYLKALKACGDVVLVADSDLDEAAVSMLGKHCIGVQAVRHGEYDFGSYKRAYAWAGERLSGYDVVYLVNDSVFGPLRDLEPVLQRMEALPYEAFCMVMNPHRKSPHMQSWFVGLRREVASSAWFADFLGGVRKLESKADICIVYETGLTGLMEAHGVRCGGLFEIKGRRIYNAPAAVYAAGVPFLKKSSFVRHGGSLGAQIKKVMDKVPQEAAQAVLADVDPTLLSASPLKMAVRYLSYLWRKMR